MLDTLVTRWFLYWLFHSFWQYSDDREIEIDNEIIDKEETDYRERGKNRRKHLQALFPSEPDNRSSGITVVQPSFVMDQPNKKQTWLYDTPGVINEKQVWWTVLFSSAMQDWALAVPWVAPGNLPYFCVLMTTVRNLSFFIKKSHTGRTGFHRLKVLGLLQYFSESTALRPTSLLSFRLDDFFPSQNCFDLNEQLLCRPFLTAFWSTWYITCILVQKSCQCPWSSRRNLSLYKRKMATDNIWP